MNNIQTKKILTEIWASMVGGATHAIIEQPIVCPIEATITQCQVNGKGFFTNFGLLAKKGALYRALPVSLAGSIPKSLIHYSIFNLWTQLLAPNGDIRKASTKTSFYIGLLTGSSECFIVNPLNFVKFRMQRPEYGYKGMVDCVRRITVEEGITAFWKGVNATIFRNSIYMGVNLATNSLVASYLPQFKFKTVVTSMIGGVAGSFASYPFEMLRAAQQHNISFFDEIVSKGPSRILSGWFPGACRLVITSAVFGIVMPTMKEFSNRLSNKDDKQKQKKQQQPKKKSFW